VIPFLLRGVNLLGIDSVMQPYENRLRAWERMAKDLPMDKLEAMIQPAGLADLPELGAAILKGGVRGRVVVDVTGSGAICAFPTTRRCAAAAARGPVIPVFIVDEVVESHGAAPKWRLGLGVEAFGAALRRRGRGLSCVGAGARRACVR
jgi:hypothetical protein